MVLLSLLVSAKRQCAIWVHTKLLKTVHTQNTYYTEVYCVEVYKLEVCDL